MKSTGNGAPRQCIENLIKTERGSVTYERLKGLDTTLIDRPASEAIDELREDIVWVIQTYEPRLDASSLDVSAIASRVLGDFGIAL